MVSKAYTVFLFEDNVDDEELARRALKACGLTLDVHVARDGEAAAEALGLHLPHEATTSVTPDLIISDLKMPKLRGDELLRRVRADDRLRDVPFVIFSSSDESSDIDRCIQDGANEYCMKPIDYNEFATCVTTIACRWLDGDDSRPEPKCLIAKSDDASAA